MTREIGKTIGTYLTSNKFSLCLLLICILSGSMRLFGLSKAQPWQDWQTSAIAFTFVYTVYVYWNGWKKGYFKYLDGTLGIPLGLALAALLVVFSFLLNDYFDIYSHKLGTRAIMVSLVITAALFVVLDTIMWSSLRHTHEAVSELYLQSLKFSDIPTALAFVVLTIYAFALGPQGIHNQHMDSFFGGTIAFQMILSNVIWTLTDDALIEGEEAASAHLTH
jgi:hypothetical protein